MSSGITRVFEAADGDDNEKRRDRFYRLVYSRKRKRVARGATAVEDKKKNRRVFAVAMNPSCGGNADVISCFLLMALSHFTRLRLTLKELTRFLHMEPFRDVYASQGIQILQGPVFHNVGVCLFFGIKQFMPLFCVDFSAIPLCFMHLHSSMFLRSMFRSLSLLYNPANFPEFMIELLSCNSFKSETIVPDEDSSHCSANILVGKSDKFYRIGGTVLTLEQILTSGEWLLVIKKYGLICYTFKAKKVMRAWTSHHVTHGHVRMYSLAKGWKLEFVQYRDWMVFIDLYKECYVRNVLLVTKKTIPIPSVFHVSSYVDSVPFHRPDTYISANGVDELFRAMTRKTANYDMDSEDEAWLSKFNKTLQRVSKDNFELIVDAFEKDFCLNPDYCFDENSAANRCPRDLGTKGALEAVSRYWMMKRKRKNTPLLRVFQNYPAKRAPLAPQHSLRQRKSIRMPSRYGGGEYCSFLKEIAAEEDALKEKQKIEAAETSANALREVATQKWERAQLLLKNADLAVYKAMSFLRIAEAAEASEMKAEAGHFLD